MSTLSAIERNLTAACSSKLKKRQSAYVSNFSAPNWQAACHERGLVLLLNADCHAMGTEIHHGHELGRSVIGTKEVRSKCIVASAAVGAGMMFQEDDQTTP